MKKMFLLAVAFAVLALCALLIRRHSRLRPAPAAAPAVAPAAVATPPATAAPVSAPPTPPMDAFQSGVKLDSRTGTTPNAEAKRRLLERLQAEERRQRPELQRN